MGRGGKRIEQEEGEGEKKRREKGERTMGDRG